ncbi:MAG: hypothetical protein RLZZ324_339 [Candidatus Parcubacteria bacterium]
MNIITNRKAAILKTMRGAVNKNALLGAGAAILLLVAGMALGRYALPEKVPVPKAPDVVVQPPVTMNVDGNGSATNPVNTDVATDTNTPASVNSTGDKTMSTLDVAWIPVSKQAVEPADIQLLRAYKDVINEPDQDGPGWSYATPDVVKIGVVRSGTYKDFDVLLYESPEATSYSTVKNVYLLRAPNGYGLVALSVRSGDEGDNAPRFAAWPPFDGSVQDMKQLYSRISDDTLQFAASDLTDARKLTDTKGNVFSVLHTSRWQKPDPQWVAIGTVASPISTTLYAIGPDATRSSSFYAMRKDGRVTTLMYEIPNIGADAVPFGSVAAPAVTWTDGGKEERNTASYTHDIHTGCGVTYETLLGDADSLGQLRVAGKDAAGGPVYVPVNMDTPYIHQMFEGSASKYQDTAAGAFERFIAKRPVFFIRDPFNRLIAFQSTDAMSAAECGKPVIYLYPPKTQPVTVHLTPQGGFTKSEPAYEGGWNVVAHTDGSLLNLRDGKTYPYLFWEGRGGAYETPRDFWVVARADVPEFLRVTLARIGLNEKERADFMEFWLPRMTAAPWYKLGFHGTQVMDALAPMTLSAPVDSRLRILMDYQELQAPVPAHPPVLGAPFARKGFTVVEWGGVLR